MKFAIAASVLAGSALASTAPPEVSIADIVQGTDLLCAVSKATDPSVFSDFKQSNVTACLPSLPSTNSVPASCQQAAYAASQAVNATLSSESPLGELDVNAVAIKLLSKTELVAKMDKELKTILTSDLYGLLISDVECLIPETLYTLLAGLPTVAETQPSIIQYVITLVTASDGPGLDFGGAPKDCTDEQKLSEFYQMVAPLFAGEEFEGSPVVSKSLTVLLSLMLPEVQGALMTNGYEFAQQGGLLAQGLTLPQYAFGNLTYAEEAQACPCVASNLAGEIGFDSIALRYLSSDFVTVWGSLLNLVDSVFELIIGDAGSAGFEATCQITPVFDSVSLALDACKPVADAFLAPISQLLFEEQGENCFPDTCGSFDIFPLLKQEEYDAENVDLAVVKQFIADVDVNVFGGIGQLLSSMSDSCTTTPPTEEPNTPEPTTGAAGSSNLSFAAAVAMIAALGLLERA